MDTYILSLLLLLSCSGAASAATLVNGTEWGSVLFNVSVPSQASGPVTWTYKTVPVILSNGACTGQFRERCHLLGNGSLLLNNINSSDNGEYSASAFSSSGDPVWAELFDLKVYALLTPPVLRTIVTRSPLIGGSNVTLQCDAGNQTVTSYTFYRDQKTICSEPNLICNGPLLNFTPIYLNDSGSYTCTIQNPVSSNTSNSLTLTVIAPVSNVTVTSNVSGLVWPGIDSVSLRCSALGTNVSYSWSLQGTTISTGTRFQLSADNSTLTISPVTTSDNGTFICTAKNVINNLNSSEVKLNLASPVSAVTLTGNTSRDLWAGQDSTSLYCTAQGSAITFSWRLSGNPVTSSPPYNITNSAQNSTLTISPVSKNDIGPFTCTASNRANNIISNGISLNINWFPVGNIDCSAPVIDQTIQLNCSWPGGKPAANVTLRFNGTEKNGTDQVISSVTSSGNIQGSNLTCNGDQLGRTSSCVLLFEPPASRQNTTIPPVTEGSAANMTVDLISGTQTRAASSSQVLPAQFSWFNGTDNSAIQTGGKFTVTSTPYVSTLKIDPVSASDSGTYYCKATNIIGSTNYYFTVNVTKNIVGYGNTGLNGGQIAGIVIGVLAAVAIIGIIIFFVMKKKKRSSDNERINNPMEQTETAPYATVNKVNGAMAETTISDDKDDIKYAEIKFPNISSTKSATPAKSEETVYSDVKNASLR